jgi:carbonic anhydrase
MSILPQLLDANTRYAGSFDLGRLSHIPARKLAVVACMDTRLNVEDMLGLRLGEAHIIRNAGGIVTDDVLRSLIISHKLLGTQEFVVINHTQCGMTTFRDEELQARLKNETGANASGVRFYTFSDLEENLRAQVARIKASPFLKDVASVHGLVYQVEDGRLRTVV